MAADSDTGTTARPASAYARTAGVLDMLWEARDLPDPSSITIYGVYLDLDIRSVTLQFDWAEASLDAIADWAVRFGGTLQASTEHAEGGPERWVRTDFAYGQAKVCAFAHIPLPTAEAIPPHEPGTRHSCPACMARCHCGPDGSMPGGQPCAFCTGEPPF